MDHKEKQFNIFTKPELEKIKLWCAYQERSHYETSIKLKKAGCKDSEIENIISELISENFLNEERFSKAFAGGKFRIKLWGRVKIKNELIKHRVSAPNIQLALADIDETEYKKTIEKLVLKKLKTFGSQLTASQKASIYRYLISKGFETDLVMEQINRNFSEDES